LTYDAARYILWRMIKSFADSETEKVFNREFSRKLAGDIQPIALRKLRMLSNAHAINDLRSPPANMLEKLSGGREGQHSICINDQYRLCFLWQDGDAHDVEIVDYH
jgi:proteic killer suppression protein